MNRRPTTQDITWLLDQNNVNQLNLDPPYQRRSVWTLKDKQFFLDTIFRNFPSPAIFLHKTINDAGKSTYHVVDGKQRTQTILDFVADKIKIAKDYGDVRLDGKKWSELAGEFDLKQSFWNYQISIEQIDLVDGSIVNAVFERLNRNSRRLTPQELRHAKYEGWLISKVEIESSSEVWSTLGIVTKARSKRMADCQFISELLLIMLEGRVLGFDQEALDSLYAKYEDLEESVPDLDVDELLVRLDSVKSYLLEMEQANHVVTQYAKGFGNFYTLWAFIALMPTRPPAAVLADGYAEFMSRVETLAAVEDQLAFLQTNTGPEYAYAYSYVSNSRGANTDLAPRIARLEALRSYIAG